MKILRLFLLSLLLPTLAVAQSTDMGSVQSADNPLTLSDRPVTHSSSEGDFRVTFPSGCSRTITRVPAEDTPEVNGIPGVRVVFTFCDRYQQKGEGCSVTSFFNVTSADGGYPGPDEVVKRVTDLLETMSLGIKKQTHLKKTLPDGTLIEGLDIFAAESSGVGQAWVRGLLYEGDIYVLAAWKNTGGLWENPEYITFFNSFKPGAE